MYSVYVHLSVAGFAYLRTRTVIASKISAEAADARAISKEDDMKGMGRKSFTLGLCVLITATFAALSQLSGCGGGSSGGGSSSDGGGTTPAITIPATDVIFDSGMSVEGGVARESTQTMTVSLPNPTGSADTYEGKAYLVLNGDQIPLSVIKATSTSSVTQSRSIYKEGIEYTLNGTDKIAAALPLLQARAPAPVTWVASVTFSINAGVNTWGLRVYDLNNTLKARMDPGPILGAIQPTSMVVTLWWDKNGTDIDLHMSPDNGVTHCSYRNKITGEMKLDYDDVDGLGPEHITIDNATGTKTYKIKVYYYADHNTNTPPGITPTTANITASINGQVKISDSKTLTAASTNSDWTSGAHVWDVGEVKVVGPSRYTVVMDTPDLTSFPNVNLKVTVTDPGNSTTPKVTGLTASNFYVINAGKLMNPVTVAAASENVYTLNFNDIIAGKRDIFVYVVKPVEGTTPMYGGLSNTKIYGTNYALLVGLNQYPPQVGTKQWVLDNAAQPTKFFIRAWTAKKTNAATGFTVLAADFTTTLKDHVGGTNRADVTVTASGITAEGWDAAQGKYSYLLSFDRPANYLDYEAETTYFKKEIWLNWCVKDVTDLSAALLAKGTGMTNTSWDNITTYTDSAATKNAILTQIQTIAGNMKKYDMFMFFFSGHGSGMPTGYNAAQYLCTYEDTAWISVNDLKAKLDLIPNPGSGITNVFTLLDACHTGNFIGKELARGFSAPEGAGLTLKSRPFISQVVEEAPGNLRTFNELSKDLTALNNTFVMTAQTGALPSYDDDNLKNGVFTHYLVKGISVSGKKLSTALANSNHDVWVTGEEAFDYLEDKVVDWIIPANGYGETLSQTPQLQDNSPATNALLIYNW
jgi:hypothetical protein